jgi:hypothetical protein
MGEQTCSLHYFVRIEKHSYNRCFKWFTQGLALHSYLRLLRLERFNQMQVSFSACRALSLSLSPTLSYPLPSLLYIARLPLYTFIHFACVTDKLRDVFKVFDRDESGFIDTDELGVGLRALGCNPTEDEIQQMIQDAGEKRP